MVPILSLNLPQISYVNESPRRTGRRPSRWVEASTGHGLFQRFLWHFIQILCQAKLGKEMDRSQLPGAYSIKSMFVENKQICVWENRFSKLSIVNPCSQSHIFGMFPEYRFYGIGRRLIGEDTEFEFINIRGDWGLKGPSAQKIFISIEIFNPLGSYESPICPLSKAIQKPWLQCEMTDWQTKMLSISGRPQSISDYGHKIPISWSNIWIHKSADSLRCPLSDEVW